MKFTKRISFIKTLIVLFITTMLFSTLYTPLPVNAETEVRVEADYADIEISTNGGSWYSTYCKGAGHKGQGVLVYLLERDGGGAVAGTTPKAFFCDKDMKNYELRAQDKYNRYPMVTKWEGTYPYWASIGDGGAIMHSTTSYNTNLIKEWLKTPSASGNSTQGIWMVQAIWGNDVPNIGDMFREEKCILVIEPILANRFAYTWNNGTLSKITDSTDYQTIIDKVNLFVQQVNASTSTGLSKDFMNWYNANFIKTDTNPYPRYTWWLNHPLYPAGSGSYNTKVAELKSDLLSTLNTISSTRMYSLIGKTIAGTPKKIVEYYRDLEGDYSQASGYVAQSGINWYRKAAHTSAYIPTGSIVCANANFNLWNQGKAKVIQCHSDYNINTYSIGMIAMLAFTSDGSPQQSTWDEPNPTPHPAPSESTGKVKIIKSYRTVDATTKVPISDDGTYERKDVANIIQIEDEPIYRLVAWKTSTKDKPTNLTSLNWETTVPAAIGQQGTDPTLITTQEPYNYLYVLLEKSQGDEPIDANYRLSQSSISRHINLNTPDQSTVNGVSMKLLSSVTFNWTIGDHHECTEHVYYTRCGGTHGCGQRWYCSSPCGDTNGDGKVNNLDQTCTPLRCYFFT